MWEEALGSASNLTGQILDADNCDEGRLLREIVETTIHKMKKVPLEVATFPVGLDEAVQDFESKVGSSIGSENVHIVGIVGMGGSGKTTLAKELYNRKRSSLCRSSFLSDVRDAASRNSLHKLQKNLLKDLRIQHSGFHNIHQGRGILARDLRSMTVLIVLDDVDHIEQMHALLPRKSNLGRGSFIIVTTRQVNVLKSWGISSIYPMKQLDPVNAKKLFCRHAFVQPYSDLGFEHLVENSQSFQYQDLIDRFVMACNGLPLSLKVFGAMVNGQTEGFWRSQLLQISRALPEEITECLKLSYDALDREVQKMFLDVACFFIGEKKSLAVAIWDGSRWSGEVGWETLVNKCLVGLDKYDRIKIHDHLRDMGREIAGDVLPSRIWKKEQMSIQEGRTLIRGIVRLKQFTPLQHFRGIVSVKQFTPLEHFMRNIIAKLSSPELQLLAVDGNEFKEEFAALSRHLVWLRWYNFNKTNLPTWLSLKNLGVLELKGAENLDELWPENMQPPLQLRMLIIGMTGKACFRGLPRSIGGLSHLKTIILHGAQSRLSGMKSLPEEFCHLKSLEFLQLSSFPLLSSLPDNFGKLINLQSLYFWRVELQALPNSFKQLTALQTLDIVDSKSFMFTSEMLDVLECMTELQYLRFQGCPQLEELPYLTTQVSLRKLHLIFNSLRKLPNNIGQLPKLENLRIWSYKLTSLPESLGALSNLQYLNICVSPEVELGLGIGSPSGCKFKSLKVLNLEGTQVCRISISDDCYPSLETVDLCSNDYLTEIETLPGNVRKIIVVGCKKLKSMTGIGGLLNLETLKVWKCPDLEVLPCPTYMHSDSISILGCPKVRHIIRSGSKAGIVDDDNDYEEDDDEDYEYDDDDDNEDDDDDDLDYNNDWEQSCMYSDEHTMMKLNFL